MMTPDVWEKSNAHYLSTALKWVQLRLERVVGESAVTTEEIVKIEEALRETERSDSPPAMVTLCHRLGLSRFEQDVLLLCVATELDTRIPGLCARAQDDSHKPFPTFALAFTLFDDPTWEALSPHRPLRFWKLIEISQISQPLVSSPLRPDERIVSYVKGLNYLDERVSHFLMPMAFSRDSTGLAPSQIRTVHDVLHRLRSEEGPFPLVQLVGSDLLSKQLVAARVAALLGRQLYQISVETLPVPISDLDLLSRLWEREGLLMPIGLCLNAQEIEISGGEQAKGLAQFLARTGGLIFVSAREALPITARPSLIAEACKPTAEEQQSAWIEMLGPNSADQASQLASQFNLNLPSIWRTASAVSSDDGKQVTSKVWEACRATERPGLGNLAQRLSPKATFNDIVLPENDKKLLKQIVGQVRHRSTVYRDWGFAQKMNRGFGISVLFAGDSGTGKTMAAEVIANDLDLDLYRIDLSAVVNKYIGETEKNLRRLFDAAEDSGAILFFDEADALFGKRSEVRDSHDRYANIEVNYLLQRMESYKGLAILATNMKSALDSSFLRRIRFVVTFPFPRYEDRSRIWQTIFPMREAGQGTSSMPLDLLDYDHLARFNLSGGQIHNIALNAAFLAAQGKTSVTMPLLLEAVRTEFLKLERPVNDMDFKWKSHNGIRPAMRSTATNILELQKS